MKNLFRIQVTLAACLLWLAALSPTRPAFERSQSSLPPLPQAQRVQDLPVRTWGSGNSGGILLGETLYLALNDGIHGYELWKTDGTPSGTMLIKDISPVEKHSNPTALTSHAGKIFFAADDGQHGHELWKSEGTPEGTQHTYLPVTLQTR